MDQFVVVLLEDRLCAPIGYVQNFFSRNLAADTEAPLVEWALKIEVSIPASAKTVFNHRAMEEDVTEK